MKTYRVSSTVELFDRPGGWHYLAVPTTISTELADRADRGVIAIRATIGDASWDTSLLPMGDDTHFIALSAKIRATTKLALGDPTTITFTPR